MATNIQKLQNERFDVFKTQDHENGDFDVTFELGGKKLYAHKFMLGRISPTLAAMFKDIWNKGDTIPIDTYGYDDFYQFLHFLYFGECRLTDDNIFVLTDMAEFYQVSIFKDVCEEYLSKIECTLQNFTQLLDVASTYSLVKLKISIGTNLWKLLLDKQFLKISKDVLLRILELNQCPVVRTEDSLEKVYEWAESHAVSMKELNPKLKLEETIKEILAEFMPLFDFAKMDHRFLIEFVVGKSLLPSPDLCAVLLNACALHCDKKVKVKIIDETGRMMTGEFFDPGNVYDEIQQIKNVCSFKNSWYHDYIYWKRFLKGDFPTQEILKKRDDVEWYLVYNSEIDFFYVKHWRDLDKDNYMIAEMFAEENFVMSDKCKIRAFF